jgi:hypothetical protein
MDTTPPAKPTGIRAKSVADKLEVTWKANTDDTVKYKVYYGTASGLYGQSIDAGNSPSIEINGLNKNVTYYVAVSAIDAAGNESPKTEVIVNLTAMDYLNQIKQAIDQLAADTGKWPNGCPTGVVSNPEGYITSQQVALTQKPLVGTVSGSCVWTAADVAKWKGPYLTAVKDPWGTDYYFDPDYIPYQSCAQNPVQLLTAVIVSFGPNKTEGNYDCDNIFYDLINN